MLSYHQFERFSELLIDSFPIIQRNFNNGGLLDCYSLSRHEYSSGALYLRLRCRFNDLKPSDCESDIDSLTRADEDEEVELIGTKGESNDGNYDVYSLADGVVSSEEPQGISPNQHISLPMGTLDFCIINHPTFSIPTVFATAFTSKGEAVKLTELQVFLRKIRSKYCSSDPELGASISLVDKYAGEFNEANFEFGHFDFEEHPYTGSLSLSIHNCSLAAIPILQSHLAASPTSSPSSSLSSPTNEPLSGYVASWWSIFGPILGCPVTPRTFQEMNGCGSS